MRHLKVLLVGLTALVGLGGLLLGAQAQSTKIVPPRPPFHLPPLPRPAPTLDQELHLESQHAKVHISGALAAVELQQTFRNTANRQVEGTYLFPLPPGAAISDFAMTINGKRTEAEILDKDKARQIYHDIVRRRRDPAILEFTDRDVVQAHIFPVNANGKVDIEMRYSQPLRAENDSFRFNLPLHLPLGGAAEKASVQIDIQSQQGIRAVYSPTHQVEVKQSGKQATVSGEWTAGSDTKSTLDKSTFTDGANRDFTLYYTSSSQRVGMNLVTVPGQDEDGYFMMMLAPDPDLAPAEIAAKDVVFVFDTSGSMSGKKMEQARHALSSLLENLNPDDRFNIITFSSDVKLWKSRLVNASKSNLAAARHWINDIKAIGGTNIDEALQQSLDMMDANNSHPQQVIFLTDGQPTVGETNITRILQHVSDKNGETSKTRLFVFGVGYDVNTVLLDSLAQENRGSADYVLPEENIETKVGALYAKIAFPVFTNPVLDWGDASVFDVYPTHLPDIFRGSQTIVFGRYKRGTRLNPQLRGTVNGRSVQIRGEGAFNGNEQELRYLPRLWAMRKVGYLMDASRRSGKPVDGEVREEIIALSKKYGIVTPLTAGLITEDSAPPPPRGPRGPIYYDRQRMPASAAPQSGRAAVTASKEIGKIRQAEQVQKQSIDLRTINGKTFQLRNGVWTDTQYDAAKSPHPKTIKFASPDYFTLVQDPQTARWLSVGDNVILVLNHQAIHIMP